MLVWLGAVLLGELITLVQGRHPPEAPSVDPNLPKADGVVESASMRGVRTEPNDCGPGAPAGSSTWTHRLDNSSDASPQPTHAAAARTSRLDLAFLGRDGKKWSGAESPTRTPPCDGPAPGWNGRRSAECGE